MLYAEKAGILDWGQDYTHTHTENTHTHTGKMHAIHTHTYRKMHTQRHTENAHTETHGHTQAYG